MNPFQFGINPQTEGEVWGAMGGEGAVPGVTSPGGLSGGANMASENPFEPGSGQWYEYQDDPYRGYMSHMGLLGKEYLTPYQQHQASRYPMLQQLYGLQSGLHMRGQGYEAPGGFLGGWAQPHAQNPFGMYGMAKGMLGDVVGMTPETRQEMGYGATGADFQNLLGMGMRSDLGLQGSGWLAGRIPAEQEKWQAQYPEQQGPTFMDYLVGKYNLGQYFGGQ